jgi:hypothetical protein
MIIGILYSNFVNETAIEIINDVIIIAVNLPRQFFISSLHSFAKKYPVGNPANNIKI